MTLLHSDLNATPAERLTGLWEPGSGVTAGRDRHPIQFPRGGRLRRRGKQTRTMVLPPDIKLRMSKARRVCAAGADFLGSANSTLQAGVAPGPQPISSSLALRGYLGRAGDPWDLDAAPGPFCGPLMPPVPAARLPLYGRAA